MLQELLKNLPSELTDLSFPAVAPPLSPAIQTALIQRAAHALALPWSPLPATSYLRYTRQGDRSQFEEAYFSRRRKLCALTLGEWVQNDRRFTDEIVDGIWGICEETAWQLPAHNTYIRDTQSLPLPNMSRPILDLFACETAALLSLIPSLLRPSLDAISPLICERIRDEIGRRILTPYLKEHFWWMGDGKEPLCNWTPWCTQNILLAAFSTQQPQAIKRRVVEQAVYSLDCFLKEYGEDGCCEEGAYYYRHSGLTLWGALTILNAVSGGCFRSLFQERKIRNIADYIAKVHIQDDWYLNYADCSAKPGVCTAREFLFGRDTENPALMSLAAYDCRRDANWDLPEEINLWYRLLTVLHRQQILDYQQKHPSVVPPSGVFYPSTGLWIARRGAWCVSVRAGDNGGIHGHNDAGSLIVYREKHPFLIDLGLQSYTAKTFSSERYQIWLMRSDWHNLPTINGAVQENGRAYGVQILSNKPNTEIAMELSPAYPAQKQPFSYQRRVCLSQAGELTVTERCTGEVSAVLSLLFCKKPVWTSGTLQVGGIGRIVIQNCDTLEITPFSVEDPQLRRVWPDTLYRVLLPVRGEVTMRFQET